MAETRKLKYDEAALRTLTREDLDALEIGAGILGTGGGGNPYLGKLLALEAMKAGYEMKILATDAIEPDALCMSIGGIGAPLSVWSAFARVVRVCVACALWKS